MSVRRPPKVLPDSGRKDRDGPYAGTTRGELQATTLRLIDEITQDHTLEGIGVTATAETGVRWITASNR